MMIQAQRLLVVTHFLKDIRLHHMPVVVIHNLGGILKSSGVILLGKIEHCCHLVLGFLIHDTFQIV